MITKIVLAVYNIGISIVTINYKYWSLILIAWNQMVIDFYVQN